MDTTKLKQIYSSFLLLPFPLSEGHKKAADWIAELGEIDGYYGRIAESLIMEKPINEKELPSLSHLSDTLKKLQHEPGFSDIHYRQYKLYLSNLDKLAKEIKKILSLPL